MKKFYITGNGFIRYTNDNWITSTQIFESLKTFNGLINDGYIQESRKELN